MEAWASAMETDQEAGLPTLAPPSVPPVASVMGNHCDRGLAPVVLPEDKGSVPSLPSDASLPILSDLRGRPAFASPVEEAPVGDEMGPARASDQGTCAEALPSDLGKAISVPSLAKREHQRQPGGKRKAVDEPARSYAPVPSKKLHSSRASSHFGASGAEMPPLRESRPFRGLLGASRCLSSHVRCGTRRLCLRRPSSQGLHPCRPGSSWYRLSQDLGQRQERHSS